MRNGRTTRRATMSTRWCAAGSTGRGRAKDGKLEEVSWAEALDIFAAQMRGAGASVAAIAGDLVDAETMYAAKALLAQAGSALLEGRQTGLDYDVTSLSAVRFNTPLADLDSADVILLVGTNPRWEAPLVNTRLLKAVRRGAKVYGIGPEVDSTYKVEWLGDESEDAGQAAQGGARRDSRARPSR